MWCWGLDARWLRRTATLMIWATFLWTESYEALEAQRSLKPVPPCFITQSARKFSRQMSLPLDQDSVIPCRYLLRSWKTQGVTEGGRGEGISISFISTSRTKNLSLAWLCQICVKLKSSTSVAKQLNTTTSPIISGEYRPPLPPPRPLRGLFYLFRDKSSAE